MYKLGILFFFTSFFSFAQKIERLEFSISEIDSLCNQKSCFEIFDYGGKLESKKEYLNDKTETQGNGYESWEVNASLIDSAYYRLNSKEQRHYNNEKNCKLIRADYSSYIDYKDGSSEKLKIYFYFNNNELFYITYKNDSLDRDKVERSEVFYFFISNIDQELSDNKHLKKYLLDKKDYILKVWTDQQ